MTDSDIQRARFRDRIANIFSAARLEAPSYSDTELWTLIEGVTIGGKPASEQLAVGRAVSEYDRAISRLADGVVPVIAGRTLDERVSPAVIAADLARQGASAHTVVNGFNLARIVRGQPPLAVGEGNAPALSRLLADAAHNSDALQRALEELTDE